MPSNLCNYCSQIDFGLLRLPRADELVDLNEGRPPLDHHPFKEFYSKFGNSYGVPRWNLGLQSRIDEESACQFCSAIRHVLRGAVASQPWVQRQWARAASHDLLCIASIDAAGSILPSKDTVGDSGHSNVTIRHICLQWVRPKDENCQSPGRISLRMQPEDKREVLSLYSCFQLRSQSTSILDVVEGNTQGPDDEFFGGRLVPEFIDPRLPRKWLEDCHSTHGDTCGRSLTGIPRYVGCPHDHTRIGPSQCSADISHEISEMRLFRLIDVQSARIVEFHDVELRSLEYATLSYVWGGSIQKRLVQANLDALQAPGSLDEVPKSIQDAICITKELLIPFLWVDALCVIQDSDEDKSVQISNMGGIYSNSIVTLVAAAGQTADAGLPGVTSPRKHAQMPVAIDNNSMKASSGLLTRRPRNSPFIHPADTTIWASRGWTFQEQELSTRLIYFLDEQILWSCANDHRSEETHSETLLAKVRWHQNLNQPHLFELRSKPSKNTHVWDVDRTWELTVRDFTNRNLSFPGDALDAVTGALQFFQSVTGREFLWGIPRRGFESNLLWSFLAQPGRRTCMTTLPSTSLSRRVRYPSWSWLGWEHHYMSWRPPARDSR